MKGQIRRVVVHDLSQATAACRAAHNHGRPLEVASAGYLGWATFRSLVSAARAAVPDAPVLAAFDPDGRAGPAAEALRLGAERIVFPPDHPQRAALADLAQACGAELVEPVADALDLGWSQDPATDLEALLTAPLFAGRQEG